MITADAQDPTPAEFQALDAWMLRMLVWLGGVIARLGAPRRSKLLHRILRLCERNTEIIVFEWADARVPPPRRIPRRPRGAPRGFRVKRIRGSRYYRHSRVALRRGAGFAARARRLIHVLAEPERCIERCVKLLTSGRKRTRLIAAAPPADMLHDAGCVFVGGVDSS